MNKIKLSVFLSMLCLFSIAQAQTNAAPTPMDSNDPFELIEKVDAKPGKPFISYEKYRLKSNDLTLIIHEDHSDPIVHVEVGYHVGSARESVRNSGFAHFFEHMMFQGSKNVADEEHFKLISRAGGNNNAFTSFDETVYVNTAPSNITETLLWLEADRMGTHLEGFTQAKFESQRNAVKNEKKQRNDNQPYGMLNEVLFKTMFANNTYEWTPIGFTDDLDIASFEDLRKFFLRWYKPNNATLVVSGDVNPQQVKDWVNKYFSTIKKGKPAPKKRMPPVILAYDQYVEMTDNVYLPLTVMAWPTVPEFHKDEAALNVLGYVLSGNNSSPLYKKLVKTEDALSASASNSGLELAGLMTIDAVAAPGGLTTKEIEAKIREVLAEFETKGCSDEELNKAKVIYKTSAINVLDQVASKAYALNHWSMMTDKSYNLDKQIAAIETVTTADVLRVFRTYIKDKKCIVINIVPDPSNGERDTSVSKSVNPHAMEGKANDPQYDGLTYEPPVDNFDRSVKPTPGPVTAAMVPTYYEWKYDNGLKFIGTKTSESPKIIISINMSGGQLLETGKYPTGTASMTAELMTEGTTKLTSEEFQNELDKIGSNISFGSGETSNSCFVSCTKEHLDVTLKLLEDALYNPRFDPADFKRIKKQNMEGVQSLRKNPSAMADMAWNKILMKGTLLEEPNFGNFKSVKKISLSDVKDYYTKCYSPSISSVVISGDISEEDAKQKMSFLKNWKNLPVVVPPLGKTPTFDKVQIYLIDKPYAPQSVVTVTHNHLPFDYNGDYFKSNIMYFPLGGNFNSRLTMNIREEHGFAYSPQSGMFGNKYYGSFLWQADVRKNATDSAIVEVMKEIEKYKKDGITEEELTFTKSSLLLSDALRYESPNQKASFLSRIVTYDLPKTYIAEQKQIIDAITKAEIDALAKRVLHPEYMSIIVIGHAYKIRDGLNKLGYGKVKEITLD